MDTGSSPVWRRVQRRMTTTIPAKAGIRQYSIPFLRKQESNGCRVKPGMVTGTAPYDNDHSREGRKPVIPNTIPAKAGIQ